MVTKLDKVRIMRSRITQGEVTPLDHQLRDWAQSVIKSYRDTAALDIHLVSTTKSAMLNQQYRQKPGPTNILSFCFEAPPGIVSHFLGDIILCPSQIAQEISDSLQPKSTWIEHWAHLVVHGCLHLLGYDHDGDTATEQMERLEIEHLAKLGYPNPY
jgi:probable rRNA maturation factor